MREGELEEATWRSAWVIDVVDGDCANGVDDANDVEDGDEGNVAEGNVDDVDSVDDVDVIVSRGKVSPTGTVPSIILVVYS